MSDVEPTTGYTSSISVTKMSQIHFGYATSDEHDICERYKRNIKFFIWAQIAHFVKAMICCQKPWHRCHSRHVIMFNHHTLQEYRKALSNLSYNMKYIYIIFNFEY